MAKPSNNTTGHMVNVNESKIIAIHHKKWRYFCIKDLRQNEVHYLLDCDKAVLKLHKHKSYVSSYWKIEKELKFWEGNANVLLILSKYQLLMRTNVGTVILKMSSELLFIAEFTELMLR